MKQVQENTMGKTARLQSYMQEIEGDAYMIHCISYRLLFVAV